MENLIRKPEDYQKHLKSENPNIRKWAITRCRELKLPLDPDHLLPLIGDSDETVLDETLAYIIDLALQEYAPAVLKKFSESSGKPAGCCALALGSLGYGEAVSLLTTRLEKSASEEEEFFPIIIALGSLKTGESLKALRKQQIIMEASQQLNGYSLATIYQSILKHREPDSFGEVLESMLANLAGIDNDEEKKRLILSVASRIINEDILDYLQFYEEEGDQDFGVLIYEDMELPESDPGASQIKKLFTHPLKKKKCRALIEILYSLSLEFTPEAGKEGAVIRDNLLLRAVYEGLPVITRQSRKIRTLLCFVAAAAYLSIREQEFFLLSDDRENLLRLFRRPVDFFPDFEKNLLEQMAALPENLVGFCKKTIEEDMNSYFAVRAIRLLKTIGTRETIPPLIGCIKTDKYGVFLDKSIDALIDLKDELVVDELVSILDAGESGINVALDVLRHYPVRRTVESVVKNFDHLWVHDYYFGVIIKSGV